MGTNSFDSCPECKKFGTVKQMNQVFIVSTPMLPITKTNLRTKFTKISAVKRGIIWCEYCGWHLDIGGDDGNE